jgi:hypothetical protein
MLVLFFFYERGFSAFEVASLSSSTRSSGSSRTSSAAGSRRGWG